MTLTKFQNDIHTTKIEVKDGDLFVRRSQDVEPILDFNKEMTAVPRVFGETFRHVASIPLIVIEQWIKEGAPVLNMDKDEFARFVKRKLNDPQWKYLKSIDGSV